MREHEEICEICKEPRTNLDHNNTLNHRFHFMKWSYNECRKTLTKNRHGVVLKVEVERVNNFTYDFQEVKGKYITMVSPEQLELHNSKISFNCSVKNSSKAPIYLMTTNLLHFSKYFKITHSNKFGENDTTLLKLAPSAVYNFKVFFQTDVLTSASYKIPLSCDFQTNDNKNNFTIVRTFLTVVDERDTKNEEKYKSPFTDQTWKDVTTLVPTTKETFYTDLYKIPYKYKNLLKFGLQRFDGMTPAEEDLLNTIKEILEHLTVDNYNRYWHILIWLEERAQEVMLRKYNMEKVTMVITRDGHLVLEVPGLAEKRPSVIVGDFIKIRVTGDHTAYKGFVCRVNEKTVEISHVDDELIDYIRDDPNIEMDVAFMLGRLSFERMHAAVDKLMESRFVEKLFPTRRHLNTNNSHKQLHNSQFYNQTICNNEEQKNAVNKILYSVQVIPYIVFGPPGTGKTVTIVEAILQIKKRTKKRILVCAPANSACDMLASKLKEHCEKEELLRIHSTTRDISSIPEELLDYSNIEDDEFTRVYPDKLKSFRIIVTTLVLIGRFTGVYKPDCVFIDEAAQASEPEADIALALLEPGLQVVLAGDPKQLGPMTTKSAEKFGLGIPLMDRLMDCDIYKLDRITKTYDTNFITMLKLNFRSHPDILYIPNKLFYNNLLRPESLSARRDPIVGIAVYPTIKKSSTRQKGEAIEFCSVSAKEKQEGSSPSFFNLFELKMVVKYVQALVRLRFAQAYKVREDQIGVVTPYKRQVHKIKGELRRNGFLGVEVGTTESFQGREKRIIILSTVRAQHSLLLKDKKYNLGFVKNDQRFNVAVTRAISKLIVIGCPLVLRTDEKWAEYMFLCQEKGTYFGNHFAEDNELFRKDVISRMKNFKKRDDQYHQH